MANPQKIVDQLLALSEDPDNQSYIVRESGCLSGLVGYLSYPDGSVALTAAKAIRHLSSGAANRDTVKEFPGLYSKLTELKSSSNAELKSVVLETLANLTPAEKPAVVMPMNAGMALYGFSAVASITTAATTTPKPKTRRSVRIKVEGIAEEYWRKMVERALIKVPGVVSVTLDQRREEAIVYSKDREGLLDDVLQAVQGLGMDATELGGSETGNPKAKTPARPTFSSIKAPTYLDDDDEAGYFGVGVMTCNIGSSSLEARLAAKRKEEEQQNAGSKTAMVASVFGSIGSTFGLW